MVERASHKKRWNNPARSCGQSYRSAVWALAGALAITVATQVHADPIRFDNPPGAGHFDWRARTVGDDVYLNILVDAVSQTPDGGGAGAFRQRARDPYGVDVRKAGTSGEGPQFVFNPEQTGSYLLGVDSGTTIPTPAQDGFTSGAIGYWTGDPSFLYDGSPTLFAAGAETYIGVQFFDQGGSGDYQYGWIGVVPEWTTIQISGVPTDVLVLDAFAWGYETEPGVPILAGAAGPIPGDVNGDGCVDLADLATLLANYGTTSGMTYEDGDLDGDGDVDLADLAGMLAHYGEGCP